MSRLLFHNRQSEVRLPLPLLRRRLERGLSLLDATTLPPVVEVSLVTRREISRVHREFMRDSSPTDVITFHHGEILVCPAVARTQAKHFGTTLRDEVLLYGLHGFLHLLGWTDTTVTQAEKMRRAQEALLAKVKEFEIKRRCPLKSA